VKFLLNPINLKGKKVALCGELGAGKTYFVRNWLREQGVNEDVPSPTFSLVQQYSLKDKCLVSHWDLYRLTKIPDDFWFDDADTVFIEWADKFPECYKIIDIFLFFSLLEDGNRVSFGFEKGVRIPYSAVGFRQTANGLQRDGER